MTKMPPHGSVSKSEGAVAWLASFASELFGAARIGQTVRVALAQENEKRWVIARRPDTRGMVALGTGAEAAAEATEAASLNRICWVGEAALDGEGCGLPHISLSQALSWCFAELELGSGGEGQASHSPSVLICSRSDEAKALRKVMDQVDRAPALLVRQSEGLCLEVQEGGSSLRSAQSVVTATAWLLHHASRSEDAQQLLSIAQAAESEVRRFPDLGLAFLEPSGQEFAETLLEMLSREQRAA